jgi:hypothetical protein
MRPPSAWWFAASDVLDVEHSQQGMQVASPKHDTFDHTFDDLVPGWCYGFAWTW